MSSARPLLAVRRSDSAPARAERLAWFVLSALACMLAHEAAYQLMYRGAPAYRSAMTLMGHDGYWLGLTVALTAAALTLVTLAAFQLRRLHREAATTPALAADEEEGLRAYLRLLTGTWLRLALVGTLLYTAQENLEALAAGVSVQGLEVILGHSLLPLIVVLVASAFMAPAVALVRWRRRVLAGRLATVARPWSRDASRQGRPVAALPVRTRPVATAWASRAPPASVAPLAL